MDINNNRGQSLAPRRPPLGNVLWRSESQTAICDFTSELLQHVVIPDSRNSTHLSDESIASAKIDPLVQQLRFLTLAQLEEVRSSVLPLWEPDSKSHPSSRTSQRSML